MLNGGFVFRLNARYKDYNRIKRNKTAQLELLIYGHAGAKLEVSLQTCSSTPETSSEGRRAIPEP